MLGLVTLVSQTVRKTGKSDFSIYFQNFLKQESWKTQLGMMVSGQ